MEQICKQLIDRLLEHGADKAVVSFNQTETSEFNLIYKELNLLRSLESSHLNLYVIKDDNRKTAMIRDITI